jgi:hypothetical protein
MARVPTITEEDAKRPNRRRQCLIGEHTRIANRMKATLARLGVRNFKPRLRKAAERLATVRTPEGVAAAAKCIGRGTARYGAAERRPQSDQGNRGGSSLNRLRFIVRPPLGGRTLLKTWRRFRGSRHDLWPSDPHPVWCWARLS